MSVRTRQVALPAGETLFIARSDGGTCTVDVQFDRHGPVLLGVTAGSQRDALQGLADRLRSIARELERLATGTTP